MLELRFAIYYRAASLPSQASYTQTSFDPNYVAVGNRSGQCKIVYILNRGIVSDMMLVTLWARARVVYSGFHSTKAGL